MNKLEKVIAGVTGLGAFTVLTAFGSREIIEYLEKERIKREVNYQQRLHLTEAKTQYQ